MNVCCLHLDMKSLFPKADYLLSLLERFAEMGYTHVLLEFEDKFPFDAFPDSTHPAAYSKAEFRSVAEKCRALGLGVIPLLQCAGHLEYFLKEPAYRKWSENGNIFQWCLSDPETLDVWKKMAGEILEVFPGCEYFHIGADEVKLKDPCPACAGKNAFLLYLDRVRACTDFLLGKGKKVLAWDDMFRNHDLNESGDLLGRVMPCVWQYRTLDETIILRYAEAGIRYWGASRIQTNERYLGMGKQRPMQQNVDDWAEIQQKYPAEGHIGTVWGRVQSLYPINTTLPQAMYMAGYLAETLQHGKILSRCRFNRDFAESFFGLPGLDMDSLVYGFCNEPELVKAKLEPWLGRAPRNGDILEVWHAFNEIDVLYEYINRCFCSNDSLLFKYRSGTVTGPMLTNWRDGVRITEERTEALGRELDRTLGKYFPQVQLDEFKRERFESMLENNSRWGKILADAAAKKHL